VRLRVKTLWTQTAIGLAYNYFAWSSETFVIDYK